MMVTRAYRNEQGQLHRTDGPAVTQLDGTQEWWFEGNLHRTDGPAIMYPDGSQVWWFEGQPHRLGGPAIIRANGKQEWYIKGKQVDELTVMLFKYGARAEV